MQYLCSESNGADQVCGYRAADLCLCFRICKNRLSHDAAHAILVRMYEIPIHSNTLNPPRL